MFGLFKKKSPLEKLNEQYKKLLAEAHQLSHKDRKASDEKMAEAEAVAQQIDQLKANISG
ncbi:MAG: Lacal_2735 family protein [Microscillaceae bacterium]|nr:Lacal_2735 family protein [Microscillaceae bacterium]